MKHNSFVTNEPNQVLTRPRAMDTERKILQKNPGKLDWNQFSVKAKGF